MLGRNRPGATDRRDEQLAARERLVGVAELEPSHQGLEAPDRISFDHHHARTEEREVARDAPSHRAESVDRDPASGHEQVRRPHEAFDHRLSDPVLVLDDELEDRVVDHDHGEVELGSLLSQQVPARRRLLGCCERALPAELGISPDQVGAVVDQKIGLVREHGIDVARVLGLAVAARADRQRTLGGEGRCGVVRGRAGAAGDDHARSTGLQRPHEHACLRLDVQAHADRQAGERATLGELAAETPHHAGVRLDPIDPSSALLDQIMPSVGHRPIVDG